MYVILLIIWPAAALHGKIKQTKLMHFNGSDTLIPEIFQILCVGTEPDWYNLSLRRIISWTETGHLRTILEASSGYNQIRTPLPPPSHPFHLDL